MLSSTENKFMILLFNLERFRIVSWFPFFYIFTRTVDVLSNSFLFLYLMVLPAASSRPVQATQEPEASVSPTPPAMRQEDNAAPQQSK